MLTDWRVSIEEGLVPRRGLELSLEGLFHIDKSIGYALRVLLRSTHVPRSYQPGSGSGSQPLESGQESSRGFLAYGVFDFGELFSQVLHGSDFFSLTKSQRDDLLKRVEADVSDHMPIWVRIPIPGA